MSLIKISPWCLASVMAFTVLLTGQPLGARSWTVEQRQAKLMQDINSGQKSGKLTAAQSKQLRKKLSDVARKKAKMKAKASGALTFDDKSTLQKKIDQASEKIKEEKGETPPLKK